MIEASPAWCVRWFGSKLLIFDGRNLALVAVLLLLLSSLIAGCVLADAHVVALPFDDSIRRQSKNAFDSFTAMC